MINSKKLWAFFAIELVLLAIAMMILRNNKAFASEVTTSEVWLTNQGDTGWTTESNLYGAPDSVYATHANNYLSGYNYFTSGFGVATPSGSAVSAVTTKFYKGTGNSGGTTPMTLYINGHTYCNLTPLTITLGDTTPVTVEWNSSNCLKDTGGFNWAELQANSTDIGMLFGNTNRTIGTLVNNSDMHLLVWDAISYTVTYDNGEPEYNPDIDDTELSLFTATESGKLKFNLSGNTGYASTSATTCEVRVFQQDEWGNSPLYYQAGEGYEATIQLFNTNTLSYTQIFPNNVYIGHGYTTTDDSWYADGVSVHYYPGQNTTFRYDYTCYANYNQSNETTVYHQQSVNSTLADYNATLVATPSATQMKPETGDNCNGLSGVDLIACNFKNWFYNAMQYLFVPSAQSRSEFNAIALDVRTNKVPWCYVNQILAITEDLQQEDSATISAVAWDFSGVDLMPDSLKTGSQNLPNAVSNLLGIVKNFFTVVVWAGLVTYLIIRFKNGII